MTDLPDAFPTAVVQRKRGLSLVWTVPIVAAGIGAWLWWDAMQQRGPEITIEFNTADGIDAGKTKIRYKSVEIGHVQSVELKPDLSGVVIRAAMQHATDPLLHEKSRFWVVRPRIGLAGVSGLDTLLSGAYLEVDPDTQGKVSRSFVGLEEPPQTPADAPGLKLKLSADTLGSVSVGSPVSHHGIVVGKVEGYHMLDDSDGLEVDVYIEPEYMHRVHQGSRFWNASGLDISFGAQGIKFTSSSLVSLLTGGVEFDTPPEDVSTPLARTGAAYRLYPDKTASREVFKLTVTVVLYFTGSLRGLDVGAPVEFKGIQLGTVASFGLENKRISEALSRVVIEVEPERIGRQIPTDADADAVLGQLVASGLRARLSVSSLLTGALFIDMVLDPTSPAEHHGAPGEIEIPTVESTSEALAATADEFPRLMADARRAIASLADLATSPDVQHVVGDFREVGTSARAAIERADAVFVSIQHMLDAQSSIQIRVASAMDEISAGMRSIRHLADMLDRQPEALIKGKSSSPGDH